MLATGPLETTLASLEKELIIDALKSAGGNMAKAARKLGLTERIMGLRITRYSIEPRRYRPLSATPKHHHQNSAGDSDLPALQ